MRKVGGSGPCSTRLCWPEEMEVNAKRRSAWHGATKWRARRGRSGRKGSVPFKIPLLLSP
eukprot:3833928-Rhodomonas_salina.5